MKKVLAACLKEIIQFDSMKELEAYLDKLRGGYRVLEKKELFPGGQAILTINKAYNSVKLIEE